MSKKFDCQIRADLVKKSPLTFVTFWDKKLNRKFGFFEISYNTPQEDDFGKHAKYARYVWTSQPGTSNIELDAPNEREMTLQLDVYVYNPTDDSYEIERSDRHRWIFAKSDVLAIARHALANGLVTRYELRELNECVYSEDTTN